MKRLIIIWSLILPICAFSQQIADTNYNPKILNPAYGIGKGSVVFIDEGHHNFHTKEGRYKSFSNLLERDGYVVSAYPGEFKEEELAKGKIMVISNALNEINVENWYLPTPSAFTNSEIEVLDNWVQAGGSLFLIADHMPLAGAAEDLAYAFGFEFSNGFITDTTQRGPMIFKLSDGSLAKNIITMGRDASENVKQVVSFTGQGFEIPQDASPILILNKNCMNLIPDTAWVFNKSTPQFAAKGWSQGAFKKYGKGKVVAFGEAAMFSAQLAGPQKIRTGMNSDIAPENFQLLLNIIHWLDGKLE